MGRIRVGFCLLLALLQVPPNLATSEVNKLDTVPQSNATKFQRILDKIETLSSQLMQLFSFVRTDDSANSQLTLLSNRMTAYETQLAATQTQLAATQSQLAGTQAQIAGTLSRLSATESQLTATITELLSTRAELEELKSRENNAGSSSFVRWGRKSCPGNTTMVYSGVAGGKMYTEKGSGTNSLCLSMQPQFDGTAKPPGSEFGLLYGGEYQDIHGHHQQDVPCSVCRTHHPTTVMIPGTMTCPPAWTAQYTGHLTAQKHSNHASEYVCLDGQPENTHRGSKNENGNMFYYTMTRCGTLPCPPYVNDKVVTCVVCSQ